MNEPVAFLNGDWIPASAAAVSVDDAGFVLGVSVAEQLRTFGGKLFRLDEHLTRLAHSLEIVGVYPGMGLNEIASVAEELAARNHRLLAPDDDLRLAIVITPGTHPAYGPPCRRPLNDGPAIPAQPTVCLHTHPLAFWLWAEEYRSGQALVATKVRQVPSSSWPAELKCRSRMHYYLADREAAAADPRARALLLDAEGFVTEASTANLLILRAGEGLVSPPSDKILPGISMSTVVELARGLGIPCLQRDLTVEDVASADEAMLTSTSTCILPVVRLGGRPIGAGRPGKVFGELLAAWSRMVGVDITAQAERYEKRDLVASGCQ
ncbi:MAG: aminotransferase class IV [Planctomycetes bacterium]|nr:aminotransferase class IV [Planctomycetota bacterium]